MQMQIYNKKTQEIIAWLDTVEGNILVHSDYGVKTGSRLSVRETDNGKQFIGADYEKRIKLYHEG